MLAATGGREGGQYEQYCGELQSEFGSEQICKQRGDFGFKTILARGCTRLVSAMADIGPISLT
jgi:hypothetical protein